MEGRRRMRARGEEEEEVDHKDEEPRRNEVVKTVSVTAVERAGIGTFPGRSRVKSL